MSNPLDHALAYAAAGFPVFPANPAPKPDTFSKAPYLPKASSPGARDGGHWLASRDEAKVRGWWGEWPWALIGFPTGLRTGCVVIDLDADPKERPARAMLAALTAWCGRLRHEDPETGEVIEAPIARTQSGGLHLYFGWPEEAVLDDVEARLSRRGESFDRLVGNRTGLFRGFLKAGECDEALGHIDVRGEGGYVIAPPSVMADGRRYEWLIPRGEVLPPLPRRLLAAITGEMVPLAEQRERAQARAKAERYSAREISDNRVRTYVERSVRGALTTAASAGEGNRNAAVFWAACRLGEFVRGNVLGKAEAEALLLAHLPAGVNPNEPKIRGTIRNGLSDTKTPAFSPDQLRGRAA
jgi:putative DNA primase/helicase